jgi:hypothetical protein
MRLSTRLFLITLIFLATGIGLFAWGMTSDLQAAQGFDASEPMRRIGQVAGALVGVGCVPMIAAVVLRLRGR